VRLAESGETDEISRRHAAAFLALAEEARPHFGGADQKRWLDVVELEHDNLRAALEWNISRGDAEAASRLVFALWRFWQRRGYLTEGANWCDRVLALPAENVPPLVQVRALEATAGSHMARAVRPRADFYTKALEIAQRIGDPGEEANAEYNLAFAIGLNLKNVPRALELLRGAREKWIHLGDRAAVGRASWALGSQLQIGPRAGSIRSNSRRPSPRRKRRSRQTGRPATGSTSGTRCTDGVIQYKRGDSKSPVALSPRPAVSSSRTMTSPGWRSSRATLPSSPRRGRRRASSGPHGHRESALESSAARPHAPRKATGFLFLEVVERDRSRSASERVSAMPVRTARRSSSPSPRRARQGRSR